MLEIGVHQSQNTQKKQVSCFNHDATFLVITFFRNRKYFRQLHNMTIKRPVLSSDFVAKYEATGSHSFTATEFENVLYFLI